MKKVALLLLLPLLLVGCAKILPRNEPERAISIYFVGDTPRGFKLFSEVRTFPKSEDLAKSVISELVSGKIALRGPDCGNLWGGKD